MGRGKRQLVATFVSMTDNPNPRVRPAAKIEIIATPNKLGLLTTWHTPHGPARAPRAFLARPLRLHSVVVRPLLAAPEEYGERLWTLLEPFDGEVKPLRPSDRRSLTAAIGLFAFDLAEETSDEPKTREWRNTDGQHAIHYSDLGDRLRAKELLEIAQRRELNTEERAERNSLVWRQKMGTSGSFKSGFGTILAALENNVDTAAWYAAITLAHLAPERLSDFFSLLARATSRKPPRQV